MRGTQDKSGQPMKVVYSDEKKKREERADQSTTPEKKRGARKYLNKAMYSERNTVGGRGTRGQLGTARLGEGKQSCTGSQLR